MSATPPRIGGTPPASLHCVCLSGLTEGQTRLLKLVGLLEAFDFAVVEAISAAEVPGPDRDADLVAFLRKLQGGLGRAVERINESVWPAGRSP